MSNSNISAVDYLTSLLSKYPRTGSKIQLNPDGLREIRITMNKLYPTECLIVKLKNNFSNQVMCAATLASTAIIIDFGKLIRENFPVINGKNVEDIQLWYDGDVVIMTDNPTAIIKTIYVNPLMESVIRDIKAEYPDNDLAKMLPMVKPKSPVRAINVNSMINEILPGIKIDISENEMKEIDAIYDQFSIVDNDTNADKNNCVVS